jgi:hypothetical protein
MQNGLSCIPSTRRQGLRSVSSNPAEGLEVCCEFCVLLGRCLCDGPIPHPEFFYQL